MNPAPFFVLGWIQFAVASAALLFLADLFVRRLAQPVERIRLVQLTLATTLALPFLALFSPWTLWRVNLPAPAQEVATYEAGREASALAARPAIAPPDIVQGSRDSRPPAGNETTEPDIADASAAIRREVIEASGSPAARSQAPPPQATSTRGPYLFDPWTLAAAAILALHGVVGVWLAVESVLGGLRLRGLLRTATPVDDATQAIWNSIAEGRGRPVRLLASPAVETPLTFGLFRPCVLLPQDLASCGDDAIRSCVAHERSHIENLDLATWRFAWACQFLFWMQPSFWRLRSELRLAQDMLADARSTAAGQDAVEYSALLVRFARKRGAASLGGALTFADRPSQLSRRIRMLLESQTSLRSRCSFRFSIGTLLAAVLLGAVVSAVRLDAAPTGDPGVDEPPAAETASPEATDPPEEAAGAAKPEEASVDKKNKSDAVAADELAGIVVDEEGKPIEGVTIDVWHWHPGNETKTDAEGRFLLKGLDPKTKAEVLISKEGYSPQHFAQRPLGGENWVVTLSDRTFLEGTIAGADGKPAANADIRASFGPVQADGVLISEVTTSGKSDEKGRYRLYLAPGTYDVQVSAGAQGVYREQGVLLGEHEAKSFPVTLKPGVRFEARVIDSVTDDPIEGFILWQWRPPYLMARSDADGKIVFDGLIPGPIEFNCGGGEEVKIPVPGPYYEHGPFGRWWSPDAAEEWHRYMIDDEATGWQRNFDDLAFDLELGMKPVTIVVEQGVTVTGRVTDPEGRPVEGATVAPARTGSGNSLTGDTRYSVKTEKDGTYRVVLPASGKATYNLTVHDGEYGQWRNWANGIGPVMQTVPGQKIENLDLQLTDGAIVRGKVTLGGKPVTGRDVRASAADKLENRYYDPTTQTKADGTFELKFIRPGTHYIQVEPFWLSAEEAPAGSIEVELEAGEVLEDVELTATPLPQEIMPGTADLPFKARVVDAEGQPVANVSVGLGILGGVRPQFGTLGDQVPLAESRTDASGLAPVDASMLAQFRQNASPLYAVDVEGKRAGIATFDLASYADLGPSAVPDPVEVTLGPATLTKIVVGAGAFEDLKAKPEPIYVSVSRDGLPLQQAGLAAAGSWELLLTPGKYRVTANAPGWSEAAEAELEIAEGDETKEVELQLKPNRMAQLIGNPAPEFQQIRTSGGASPVTLAELRGKVVLIDFWGNWCGPCVAAMPNLIDLQNEYRARGVEVVALHDASVDSVEELDEIVAGLVKDQWNGRELPFPVLLDGADPAMPGAGQGVNVAAYGIAAFPTTIVIDRRGNVVGPIYVHDLKVARERLDAVLSEKDPK
ncbi:MAG TPA: carboxypeptidase regulatory-like domain-containing protein [Pirellulaceae bacterium]|jgi:beta-lactamase regulating signal transducer with metallopeptidase domain/thiol-disulfide isomerase/thioredoxin|nr:carboxypeptidase regulatory-like domain-containing protein [Pirellulaceae bacterium]